MKRRPPAENTGRVLALALAFFGSLAALGFAAGVHTRLGLELLAMLTAFAIGFLALTWHLDPQVRAYVVRAFSRRPRKSPAKSPARSPAAT